MQENKPVLELENTKEKVYQNMRVKLFDFTPHVNAPYYRLRPIKRGQFRFTNIAHHFKEKCHFHFLIHWFLLKFL